MSRFALPSIGLAVLLAVFAVGLQRDPTKLPSPLLGSPLPQFDLPDLVREGERVRSGDLAGRYSLINVWASWCFACREEHDFLLSLSTGNVIPVYGLNWRDDRRRALKWLADLGDPYVASAFDADGRAGIDFGVYGAPETFLVNPGGRIVHKHIGPLTPEIWREDFLPLIEDPQS